MIGVFDSGVGGLAVWHEIVAQLPNEPTVYLADQGHVPYGARPMQEIRAFSEAITRFLLGVGCRIIVVACNTASAAALTHLRATFADVPFVGMEPAVKPAAQTTHVGRVGVMATPATFQGELFASVVERFANSVQLINQVCPGLVEQVEAGRLDTPDTEAMLCQYLAPMLAMDVDTIVLACTHYPFLAPAIQRIAGPDVQVIDPAPAIARQARRVMEQRGLLSLDSEVSRVFYTTGDVAKFVKTLTLLTGASGDVRQARWDSGQSWTTREASGGLLSASSPLFRPTLSGEGAGWESA
jgi:glutamate racemase